jgi:hypothetical protein
MLMTSWSILVIGMYIDGRIDSRSEQLKAAKNVGADFLIVVTVVIREFSWIANCELIVCD